MSVVTSVYQDLRHKIVTGRLQASADLTEMELSKTYDASRNTIKKALLMLANEQLIVLEPNRGARVKTYSVEEVIDYLAVRVKLEGMVIELLAGHLNEQIITALEDTLVAMERYLSENNITTYSEQNQLFHKILYDACPNRMLIEVMDNIKLHISKYSLKTDLVPGRAEKSLAEHRAIIEALKAEDYATAKEAMVYHVSNVRTKFEQNYHLLL